MAYHPDTGWQDLPPISCIQDLDKLPWGGNAWWDIPIMFYIEEKIYSNTAIPKADRLKMYERADFLLTGEHHTLTPAQLEAEFDARLNPEH